MVEGEDSVNRYCAMALTVSPKPSWESLWHLIFVGWVGDKVVAQLVVKSDTFQEQAAHSPFFIPCTELLGLYALYTNLHGLKE